MRPALASLAVGRSWYCGLDATRFDFKPAMPGTFASPASTASLAACNVCKSFALTSTCIWLLLAFALLCAWPTSTFAGPAYPPRARLTPFNAVSYWPFWTRTKTWARVGSAGTVPGGANGSLIPPTVA